MLDSLNVLNEKRAFIFSTSSQILDSVFVPGHNI